MTRTKRHKKPGVSYKRYFVSARKLRKINDTMVAYGNISVTIGLKMISYSKINLTIKDALMKKIKDDNGKCDDIVITTISPINY